MRRVLPLYLFFLLFIQGCKDAPEDLINDSETERIDITNPLGESITQSNNINDFLSDDYFIVPLKTTEKYLIGYISNLQLFDEKIFLLDEMTNSIFIYDMEENPINKIHNIGQGPGEYHKIVDFCINRDEKELLLLDNFTKKILIYSLKGDFLQEKKLNVFAEEIEYIGNERYAFYNNYNPIISSDRFNLRIVEDDFSTIVKRYFKHTDNLCRTRYGKWDYMWDSNESINLIPVYSYNIYNIQSDTVVSKYYFDFGKYQMPKDKVFDNMEEIPKGYDFVNSLTDFFETEKYLTLTYLIKNDRRLIYYNKKDKKIVYTKANHFIWGVIPSLKMVYWGGYPMGVYRDYFISIMSMRSIKAFIDNSKSVFKDEKDYKIFQELEDVKLLKDKNPEDNPVLLFYKLKD